MVEFLSDGWFQRADELLSGHDALGVACRDVSLRLLQKVEGGPRGGVRYQLRFDRGAAGLDVDPEAEPHVTFSLGYATAVAIAQGTLSAQAAFAAGDLQVEGDVTRLIDNRALVATGHEALAPLHAATTWSDHA